MPNLGGQNSRLTKTNIMNFETDYLADTIVDEKLREKLIKSRKKNANGTYTMYPVVYEGRRYWNISHAITEERVRASNETFKKVMIYLSLGTLIYIFGMFHVASFIINFFM